MSTELQIVLFPEVARSELLSFEVLVALVVVVCVFGYWLAPGGLAWALSKKRSAAAIPGPSGFPVIGLLPVFTGATPHRALARLARSFDAVSLMGFSVGLTRFVISSSPETAREVLGSSAFADRPVKESAYELLFHRAMGFAPYGDYWRNLRRISATHLFSPRRIAGFGGLRREIGLEMVGGIERSMAENGEVAVRRVLHYGSLNNVMATVFGRRYDFSDELGPGAELEALVAEGYELLGAFNWSDHFPVLGLLDLQGVRKRCRSLVKRVNTLVAGIIAEHRASVAAVSKNPSSKDRIGDFVDVLLDLEKEDKLSDSDMIAVLWEMIFRGTDTVAILLEWILARMMLHPEIQAKAQSELQTVVGSRPVADSDVPNLPYLQAVVKETLRVHPPGPLLSWARLAVHDVHVAGHFVPAGTTAMVNMWSIAHDPSVWASPETFAPERFSGGDDVSVMGGDLRLAPFGSGRRVCPGKAMGLAAVHLWLAQLLQSFTFVPVNDAGVDLTEVLKLSLEMKNPLVCKAVPRTIDA